MFIPILGTPVPTQQETLNLITEKKPAIVKVVEPTLEEKIKKNVNNCNTDTQYIRADNAECLNKPQYRLREQKAPETPVRASNGYNDMDYGYCTWFVKNLRPDLPTGLGHANSWYSRAQAFGLSVGSTPRVGAVATTTRGGYGHVSYVTGIEGNLIHVTEMNVAGWNVQSSGTYPASDYLYIY
jgi:surface antigen